MINANYTEFIETLKTMRGSERLFDQVLKHKEVMEAYFGGAEIQYWSESSNEWRTIMDPTFGLSDEYRIKNN